MTFKQHINSITQDAVIWLGLKYWKQAKTAIEEQTAMEQMVSLLVKVPTTIKRDSYIKALVDEVKKFNQAIEKQLMAKEREAKQASKRLEKAIDEAHVQRIQSEINIIENEIERLQTTKLAELGKPQLVKYVNDHLVEKEKEKKDQAKQDTQFGAINEEDDRLPKWVNVNQLYTEGFVMNSDVANDRIGIYYKGENKPVERLTNYIVNPLFFVRDPYNSRRLIEVYNGRKNVVVELPNRAFIAQDVFETEIVGRGAFYSEPGFAKPAFKRLVNWLSENMLDVHSLNTLGWQSEGFFAFSNLALDCTESNMTVNEYNEFGIVKISDKSYLSEGASKLNDDNRLEDNPFENDMYLKYVESKLNFSNWASLFHKVYEEDAMYGIAFVFIAAFKDLVTKIAKCPLLYCYGPKGSGKSEFAESLMFFFFSGKNADGKLIQGYNLNVGQGTPFSFFSRMERFRNTLMLYNEYDPNTIEPFKKGAFKSAYDGEGREVGSGESGKKRKTKIQKTNCVAILAGQYLDTTDDGSVLSRSIPCKFSLERNKSRTDIDKQNFRDLKEFEHEGLSGILSEIYAHRNYIVENLKETYWATSKELNDAMKKEGKNIEARLMSNYTLITSILKLMSQQLQLPFTMNEVKLSIKRRMTTQAELLKDNNVLNSFWRVVESLYDDGQLTEGLHFKVKTLQVVEIQSGSARVDFDLEGNVQIMYIRFNAIYERFARKYREVYNKTATDQDTLITYLQDQNYYLGLNPGSSWKDKKTSSYVLIYDLLKKEMNVSFEKEGEEKLF